MPRFTVRPIKKAHGGLYGVFDSKKKDFAIRGIIRRKSASWAAWTLNEQTRYGYTPEQAVKSIAMNAMPCTATEIRDAFKSAGYKVALRTIKDKLTLLFVEPAELAAHKKILLTPDDMQEKHWQAFKLVRRLLDPENNEGALLR